MSQEDHAAGASAARNKLAGFLRERGLKIPFGYTPPENDDFWYAIQEFAERYGATLPHFGEESVASRNFREALESYKTQQEIRPNANVTNPRITEPQVQETSKGIKCKHCGELFVPERGKRTRYINECPDCLHEITFPGPRAGGGPVSERTSEKIDQIIANALAEQRRPKTSRVSAALARVLEEIAKRRRKP
jgi:hypothetical protein